MGYDHSKYTVANYTKQSEKIKTEWANNTNTHNEDDPVPVMVDGLPLEPKCAAVLREVQRAIPNLKFLAANDKDINGFVRTVALYREGDAYVLGRVGYRDVAVNGYKERYFVHSRKIINQKIYGNRWQHHAKSSEKLESVVKYARQFLIPYSPTELSDISVDEFTQKTRRERSDIHSAMRQKFRTMLLDNEELIVNELKHLVTKGYTFLKPEFAERVAAYLSAEGAYTQQKEQRLNAYFMNIGDTTTEIVEYEDMVTSDNMYDRNTKPKSTTTVPTADIPFDLQMKIASLQVAEPMHYVDGLGMRVGDRSFWVQR